LSSIPQRLHLAENGYIARDAGNFFLTIELRQLLHRFFNCSSAPSADNNGTFPLQKFYRKPVPDTTGAPGYDCYFHQCLPALSVRYNWKMNLPAYKLITASSAGISASPDW
jgi:hypothetical protein